MGRKRARNGSRHRRNDENPNTPLNLEYPDDATYGAFGAARSLSGVRVNRRKALGYPAVWRAVNLISGDVAKLPLCVYHQVGRNREAAVDHPAYRLLRRKPNDGMTAFVFKQTIMAHLLTEGNAYAFIDRDKGGRPLNLLLLNPDNTTPIRLGGDPWYVYNVNGEKRKIPGVDVLHFKGLGFDGLQGYPVLRVAAESLGVALAARDFSGRYFKNDARPGGALIHPGKLTSDARRNMRESWERLHTGLENRHKVAILEEGVTYVPFQVNAKDTQLLQNREFDSREIANIFGVPTHKLGDPSKVAYNSLEQENQSYYDDTLSRWLRLIAEENHDKLLTEEEKAKETHFVDFDYQEIQRANLSAQVTFANTMVAANVIDQNEARAIFGYNPREETAEPAAEPVATTPKKADPAPAPENKPQTNGLRAILTDTAARMVRRLTAHAERAAKTADWSTWPTQAERDHGKVIAEAFAPGLLCARELGFDPPDADSLAKQLISDIAGHLWGVGGDRVALMARQIEQISPSQVAENLMKKG